MLIQGYDASFGRTTAAWCHIRKLEGFQVAYYDAFTGGEQSSKGLEAVAGPNLTDAKSGGIPHCFFYTNVAPWHSTGAYCIDQAKRVAGVVAWSSSADVLVIDMEIAYWQPTGEWLVEEVVHEAIAEAKARGFRVLLYTANWVTNFWAIHLGHMPRFDCDGIYARYDGVPVIQQPEGPHCLTEGHSWIGKQYGGQNLDGVEIDLNVFDSNWFEQEEDWMAQLSDGAIANMEKFFGQTDLLLDGSYGRFIQEQGQPAIYLLLVSQTSWGTGIRVTRHACPNPETFALLGGQWDGVNIISAAQMAKILLGKPLPDLS